MISTLTKATLRAGLATVVVLAAAGGAIAQHTPANPAARHDTTMPMGMRMGMGMGMGRGMGMGMRTRGAMRCPMMGADTVDAAQVSRGDSVFHGRAGGGTCFSCHQQNAKGLPGLAPDLTDGTWIHGDGSLQFIRQTVHMGVAKPKQAAAPMPPMGGAKLSMADIHAVAAYVWSLSQKKG